MTRSVDRRPPPRFLPALVRATLAVLLLVPPSAEAQAQHVSSRNLPTDHWAYEYIQRLRTRGYLENLSPLATPYRRGEIARGLAELDPDTLRAPVAGWVRLLREEFHRELHREAGRAVPRVGIVVAADAVGSTDQRLDPLRPGGDAHAWPDTRGGVWVEHGPFSSETRLAFEGALEDDPDAAVDQGRIGRADNAYLSVGFPWIDVWFGRFKQNWSALGTQGRMVSDLAPAYNQLAFEIRVGPFALRSLTGELETLSSATAEDRKRYLSAHRFEYRSPHVVLAVGEATLFATERGFQFRFLNPLEGTIIQTTTRAPGAPREDIENSVVEALGWFGKDGFEAFFEFLVDDIDVRPGPLGAEPFTYAFTVGARTARLAPWIELGVEYGQVSAWAYRAPAGVDQWSFVGRGLGDNFSDFDRLTLTADLFTGLHGLRLTPTVQVQRQGEGNFRDPVPPREIHVQSPALFLGVTETTYRLGLRGRFQPHRFVRVTWDVGQNIVRNAGHIENRDESDFTAVVRAGVFLDLPLGGW